MHIPDWSATLAIEERHRRASLLAQPSISETDAVNNPAAITPNSVPIAQPQNPPGDPSVANLQLQTNPATVASPQLLISPGDPSVANAQLQTNPATIQSSPRDPSVVNAQLQTNPATVPGPHPQSSLADPYPWFQTTAVNSTTVASPQLLISPGDPSVANAQLQTNPATIQSSPRDPSVVNAQLQTNPATIPGPQPQSSLADPYPLFQTTAVNSTTASQHSPQLQSSMANPLHVTGTQCQPNTVNPAFIGLQAINAPQLHNTPSTLNNLHSIPSFGLPTMPQSDVTPDSPLTRFLNSTSPFELYSFDFSGTNLSPPNSGPAFGMDQYWNSSGAPLLSTTGTTPTLPNLSHQNTPHLSTADLIPAPIGAYSALNTGAAAPQLSVPTSNPAQNTARSITDFIPASISTCSALNPGSNTMDTPALLTSSLQNTATLTTTFIPAPIAPTLIPNATDGLSLQEEEDDKSKKRKTYEEQNSHCILPEGSRRQRKIRRAEDAEDGDTSGPKKRNANKKGKGSKGKK